MISFREKVVGDSPLGTVRGVGESHEIVKQTDFGFGVDRQAQRGTPRVLARLAHQNPPT